MSSEYVDGRIMYSVAYDDGDGEDIFKSDIYTLLDLYSEHKDEDTLMNDCTSVDDEKSQTTVITKKSSESIASVLDSQDEADLTSEETTLLCEELNGKPSDDLGTAQTKDNSVAKRCRKKDVLINKLRRDVKDLTRETLELKLEINEMKAIFDAKLSSFSAESQAERAMILRQLNELKEYIVHHMTPNISSSC
eukprot:CAMPEP_0116044324 /NCGR_PEP_ID=MMETSP0321-20121206/26934_1 /TAXON_ID=163516 /ORGANISM="Leptocylindrus danicus var. danicus, Strain B650" /LENGTH=192 /DNA_ID=CAMNT_0003525403 /DNA_START=167 /DNA_END=745 /DNA_ORIENTATION=+